MFQLDDTFLAEVGLGDLPVDQRQGLLQHIYEELELRVGSALSDGMSDAELEEFEAIIDRNYELIVGWLDMHTPDFLDDPIYQRMARMLGDTTEQAEVVCEYAATKWLEINRPDYRDVVAAMLEVLKSELRRDADRLLGAV